MRLTGTTTHFQPGLLVDHSRDLCRDGQEFLHPAAMEHEQRQLLGLGVPGPHARRDDLTQLQSLHALRDGLEIVWIIVLTVDEDDFLGAAGNVDFPPMEQAEVAGPY